MFLRTKQNASMKHKKRKGSGRAGVRISKEKRKKENKKERKKKERKKKENFLDGVCAMERVGESCL